MSGGAPWRPYANLGGITRRLRPPTRIPSTPISQPSITCPAPSRNRNGGALRLMFESNSRPRCVPRYLTQSLQPLRAMAPVPTTMSLHSTPFRRNVLVEPAPLPPTGAAARDFLLVEVFSSFWRSSRDRFLPALFFAGFEGAGGSASPAGEGASRPESRGLMCPVIATDAPPPASPRARNVTRDPRLNETARGYDSALPPVRSEQSAMKSSVDPATLASTRTGPLEATLVTRVTPERFNELKVPPTEVLTALPPTGTSSPNSVMPPDIATPRGSTTALGGRRVGEFLVVVKSIKIWTTPPWTQARTHAR